MGVALPSVGKAMFGGPDGLAEKIGMAILEVTKLRGEVELLLPGSLPNDGRVIEDARSYK